MLRSRPFCYDRNGFKTGNCLMLNAVAPFIGNVQLSNIMLRNQQVCVYKNVILYKVAATTILISVLVV